MHTKRTFTTNKQTKKKMMIGIWITHTHKNCFLISAFSSYTLATGIQFALLILTNYDLNTWHLFYRILIAIRTVVN